MKIFLHFCRTLLYNKYIEKKKLEKRSIVLKCKYCWSTNITKLETGTVKRKSRTSSFLKAFLTLIQVGFLGVRFQVGSGFSPLPANLCKTDQSYPRNLKFVRKYTFISNFRKHTFQYQETPNFAAVSIFLQKISFFCKNSTFTQSNSARAVLKIFEICFQFLQDKRLLLMKI